MGVVVVLVVLVLEVVVVVVLLVCPQDPPALRRDRGPEHHVQPLGLQGLVDGSGGFAGGLDRDRGRGSHIAGSVWLAAVVVCGGQMGQRLEMGL